MCGRFLLDPTDSKEIEEIIWKIEAKNQEIKTGEIFPTNTVPLLVGTSDHDIDVEAMAWGFHGFKKSQSIINARSETVTEKKMFAKAFSSTRCVFPTSGFYEWDQEKRKFLFREKGAKILYLAGFYKKFEDGNRSIILTTAANKSIEAIHNRMPVILEKETIDRWLFDDQFATDYLKQPMPDLISSAV
ncbi:MULTISPECIES: SOS response-associated peptidase [unclassified Enterococcus]|uniref:SOS response-associated peptidase n=1 Tax=unclassified Enterococcus TaxID=2608891 RepID=UPI001CE18A56|nr:MULTISPECIES: SOS response-associated peptidase family protein [unclassified Enterococcus]MCA5014527.1 SOS response-associated peptidase [Enterococcus sp. S23]MCA5017780.1 SOS response-associated peptidase [Enterococcus sp. S22(2020)]